MPWGHSAHMRTRFLFLFAILCAAAFPVSAHASSLAWGNENGSSPAQVEMFDGGTYAVPLNVSAASFVNGINAIDGTLYRVDPTDNTLRFAVATLYPHDASGGDTEFAWPSAGEYEIDIESIRPPAGGEAFNDNLKRWIARILFADIAYAGDQPAPPLPPPPPSVETLHFTIQEAPPPCTESCFSNVLFLPGIESSRLYRPDYNGGTDKLWEPNINSDVQDLFLNQDGTSVRNDVYTKERDVLDELPVTGTNIYKSFIAKMDDLKTQNLINDWEPIAYDWRLSLDDILSYGNDIDGRIYYSGDLRATSTPYIIQELKRLAATSKSGKVTIIAHSNGGLVAKRLTEVLGAEASTLIDKMIFVAVPQAGTPMDIPASLHGYEQEHGPFDFATTRTTARAFASTSPMAYNLLPSAQYFTQVDDPVVTFDSSLPDWIAKYGDVIHSQERLHAFLSDSFGRVDAETGDVNQPIQLSDSMLSSAETLHADLDNWTPPAGVELIQIAGWGVPNTVSGITYKKKDGVVTFEASTTIDGDGTVVAPSALWTSKNAGAVDYWLNLKSYSINLPLETAAGFFPFNHGDILEVTPLLDFIADTISSNTKPISNYAFFSTEAPASTDHRLSFALHSPLTLNLYDDFGRHTGMSTTTGQLEEQIPGTYYQELGDVKYLFADASASFHVVLEGTGSGTFTFVVNEMQGDSVVDTTTFSDIPVTPQTVVTMDLSSGLTSASNLSVDENGNGANILSYASSTGELIIPEPTPAPASLAESSGGGGGGGIPSLLPQFNSTATVATTSTSSVAIALQDGQGTSTPATSTVARVVKKSPVSPRVATSARSSAHAAAPVEQKAQVASAAQVTEAGLWVRVYGWIMGHIRSLFK